MTDNTDDHIKDLKAARKDSFPTISSGTVTIDCLDSLDAAMTDFEEKVKTFNQLWEGAKAERD